MPDLTETCPRTLEEEITSAVQSAKADLEKWFAQCGMRVCRNSGLEFVYIRYPARFRIRTSDLQIEVCRHYFSGTGVELERFYAPASLEDFLYPCPPKKGDTDQIRKGKKNFPIFMSEAIILQILEAVKK